MERALQLAVRGEGSVEPNPMVGCVLAREGEIVGEGWHTHFGGPHAEVAALETAGKAARGATAYVTLEPCCHQGKTPPCTEALIAAGVVRVVYALADPSPHVDGGGAAALRAAGVDVASRLLEKEARELCAPYLKRVTEGRPWIIAKWAMSLDGRLATRAGDSQWISGEESRAIVHGLRGRVDAVMVGRGTAVTDDPLLTARPPGPRTATRIVVDSTASLPLESQLVRTASEGPVLVATGATADEAKVAALEAAGCEVFCAAGDDRAARFALLLDELGRRKMTNVLVEGGAELLGSLFDARLVDEVHAFVAPKIIGGAEAPAAVGGRGVDLMSAATQLARPTITTTGDDVYVRGRVVRA
ncbi:MAG: bifunctional diaminohydroxyphosphoribosylaminopyrimidine deaminase/5-amino-6-(5-phosphoribosylamino)uracil reductase RibD [Planctomycetota bacterium]|nr:MAG: bifunctional diaminohydroxyphosphoribosylaminopyrimidine deaminase/5-amino-6-(5-phosphoribosylamino)uracil reductase RibD [Planctomycetota bacterium]